MTKNDLGVESSNADEGYSRTQKPQQNTTVLKILDLCRQVVSSFRVGSRWGTLNTQVFSSFKNQVFSSSFWWGKNQVFSPFSLFGGGSTVHLGHHRELDSELLDVCIDVIADILSARKVIRLIAEVISSQLI